MSDSSEADCFAEASCESTHSTKVKKRTISPGADSVNAEASCENTDNIKGADLCG